MSELFKYPRGSEWRKWDLHVHSPLSGLNNQYPKKSDGSPDWDQFISVLEGKDISVLGITDYFSIDGYKDILDFHRKGKLNDFALVLPNIELRLDTFVVETKSKEINFHIIFSEELNPDHIEKEFIEALTIQVSGSISGLEGKRQLNKNTLIEVGKKIKEHHGLFKNDSDIEAAYKNITVSLEEVQKLLMKDLFKGKFLFVLAGGEWSDIDWNQAYLTKKNFLQAAHILETGSLDTVNWALGKKDLSKEDFIREFGRLKPCIHGSDAHRLDKICSPDNNKFCWIKADPTFEGLKQIIYEPEERVYIGEEPPGKIDKTKIIKSLKLSSSNGWFEDDNILEFNDNLISIIGGKGTGKTALLDLIAYASGSYANGEKSFLRKAAKNLKGLKIRVEWEDGSPDEKEISETIKTDLEIIKVKSEYIDKLKIVLYPENLEEKNKLTTIYSPIMKSLEESTENEEKLFAFTVKFGFDLETMAERGYELIDHKRKGRFYNKSIDALRDELTNLIFTIDIESASLTEFNREALEVFLNRVEKLLLEDENGNRFKIGSQLKRNYSEIDFYNWLYSTEYYSINYSLKFNDTELDNLSPGLKGVALLILYLELDKEDTRPILIDQPEENLDNRSVYEMLVDYFRKAKRRRQAIIITHNPNLVVNTDSEQIIVANFDRERKTQSAYICYRSGSLENTFEKPDLPVYLETKGIREHICQILEGGKEAFEKREQKYGFA
ncbi:MAG: AAA family ATPase [Nitrospirota bacterium]